VISRYGPPPDQNTLEGASGMPPWSDR